MASTICSSGIASLSKNQDDKASTSQVDPRVILNDDGVAVFAFDNNLSISALDASSIPLLIVFIGKVAEKKGIKTLPVSKTDPNKFHFYTLGNYF